MIDGIPGPPAGWFKTTRQLADEVAFRPPERPRVKRAASATRNGLLLLIHKLGGRAKYRDLCPPKNSRGIDDAINGLFEEGLVRFPEDWVAELTAAGLAAARKLKRGKNKRS